MKQLLGFVVAVGALAVVIGALQSQRTVGEAQTVESNAALAEESAPAAQPQERERRISQELIKLDMELASAEASGNVAVVDRLLAPEYTLTDQTGRVSDKARSLSIVGKEGATHPKVTTDDYGVKVFGDTAVMTHRATIQGAGEQAGAEELRTTHVWVNRGGNWQIVSDQCTSIAFPQLDNVPFLDAACSGMSFEPEVLQFYGDSTSIAHKLEDDRMRLPERRLYILLLETAGSAELALFEKDGREPSLVNVSSWRGRTLGDLRDRLTSLILDNRGIACVGEQSKALVEASVTTASLGSIPAPVSAKAAFSHLLRRNASGEYMRMSVLLLC